ncbi:hypothetical protein BDQ17DRAFT_846199 [Cyathus striatus]|nr:hypothetical protein BDQ17DRAFT_846199 [Cyathus striatus]
MRKYQIIVIQRRCFWLIVLLMSLNSISQSTCPKLKAYINIPDPNRNARSPSSRDDYPDNFESCCRLVRAN